MFTVLFHTGDGLMFSMTASANGRFASSNIAMLALDEKSAKKQYLCGVVITGQRQAAVPS
ncbi:hypothetical protein FGD67_00010 [Colwellia sp. M166]|nr:hypothetical protein FGD67_00010 [Colwellia sp. M166]